MFFLTVKILGIKIFIETTAGTSAQLRRGAGEDERGDHHCSHHRHRHRSWFWLCLCLQVYSRRCLVRGDSLLVNHCQDIPDIEQSAFLEC